MRVANDHPHTCKDGSVGYIHRFDGDRPKPEYRPKPKPEVHIEAEPMMERWRKRTEGSWFAKLADNLGVSASSLMELRAAWAQEHRAWAFPMRDGQGRVVGIRLRTMEGAKFAVRGSKQGIFLPYLNPESVAYIVEGPTNCAAGLTLGLFTVGRPSCSGGLYDLKSAFQRLGVDRAVIIADNDEDKEMGGRTFNPGLDGAESLARTLCIPCATIMLPTKDIRSFLGAGGTSEYLETIVKSCVWRT
jgi:hypothetical protein